jgi:GDP-L-fucose synthase
MTPESRIFVAGHRGMVGSAIVRLLQSQGFSNLILRERSKLDLLDPVATETFFRETRPEVVVDAAAKVGGIVANNSFPADFIRENLLIQLNLIESARKNGTSRLLFLGSSCIYPREAPQPMREDCLLTSPLEKTNEAYAIAKIAGLKLCEYYRKQYGLLYHSAMPTNLYGPGDYYHPTNSHVLPALLRRFHEAKENKLPSVTLWGSGTPRREFLHTDDLAAGVLFLLRHPNPPDWVNIGSGTDVSIRELAEIVRSVTGFEGKIEWDTSKPDGTPRKLMDNSLIRSLGWSPKVDLAEGIARTYRDFLAAKASGTLRE